jgi:hypothetical protein
MVALFIVALGALLGGDCAQAPGTALPTAVPPLSLIAIGSRAWMGAGRT